MKYINLLFAGLLLTGNIDAQDSKPAHLEFEAKLPHKIFENPMLLNPAGSSRMIEENGEQYIGDWVEFDTTTIAYHSGLNSSLYKYSTWNNVSSQWDYLSNNSSFYDTQGRIDYSLSPSWDGSNWNNNYKTDYIYNDADNLYDEFVSYSWSGAWNNSSKAQFTYNSAGSRLSELGFTWSLGAWENNYRVTMIYDMSNNMTEYTMQSWDGTVWNNTYRYLYSYNSNNQQLTRTYQTWVSGNWENDYKYVISYNTNGGTTEYKYQDWVSSAWVDMSRYLYLYNGANLNDITDYQTWNGTSWVDQERDVHVYDLSGKVESTTNYNMGMGWTPDNRQTFNYDVNDKVVYSLYQVYSFGWMDDFQYFYKYENYTPIATEIIGNANVLGLFPNPASDMASLIIDAENEEDLSIEIFNSMGQSVHKEIQQLKSGNNNIAINIRNLSPSVYYLRIAVKNSQKTLLLQVK